MHSLSTLLLFSVVVAATSCTGRAPPSPDAGVTTSDAGTSLPDAGPGGLEVDPVACAFGRVGVGVTAFCDLSLRNTGTPDLAITNIGFDASTDITTFGSASAFGLPTFIGAGTAITLRLTARPAALQTYTGNLLVSVDNHTSVDATVPLSVTGALVPTACASVKSINGVPNTNPNPTVQPLDDVVITGDCSTPSSPGGAIASYHWNMLASDKPPESSLVISSPNSKDTHFSFNSSGQPVNGLDVAGTFTARLAVTDSDGLTSTNDAHVTFNVVPTGGMHVQLTWDAADANLDLHLVRNHGALCSSDDCNASNCVGTPELDWGGGGHNPHLDVDDTAGFGPENIGVLGPTDGDTYTAAVDAFHAPSPTNATVKIFVFGALRFAETRALAQTGAVWTVAEAQWANSPVLSPVDTFADDANVACLAQP
jgi:hypothetical protein